MPSGEITTLLAAVRSGDPRAASELASLVYGELHSLARRYMRRERPDHTLQPTALVNEAWIRLMRRQSMDFHDRAHFFATAATVMRRYLVDHARERSAGKRAGGKIRVEFTDGDASLTPEFEQLVVLDEALTELSQASPRQARVVEMIYFGGLTHSEAAAVLKLDERTIKRDWASARAWLQAQLNSPRL